MTGCSGKLLLKFTNSSRRFAVNIRLLGLSRGCSSRILAADISCCLFSTGLASTLKFVIVAATKKISAAIFNPRSDLLWLKENARARKIKGKIVKGASAVIECTVLKVMKTGDHDFFVAKCETSYANTDFRDYWEYNRYSPALYAGSHKDDRGKSHRFARLARRFTYIPYLSS